MNLLVNTSQMSQLLLLVVFHCELLFASSFKGVGVHVLCFSRIVLWMECAWPSVGFYASLSINAQMG